MADGFLVIGERRAGGGGLYGVRFVDDFTETADPLRDGIEENFLVDGLGAKLTFISGLDLTGGVLFSVMSLSSLAESNCSSSESSSELSVDDSAVCDIWAKSEDMMEQDQWGETGTDESWQTEN